MASILQTDHIKYIKSETFPRETFPKTAEGHSQELYNHTASKNWPSLPMETYHSPTTIREREGGRERTRERARVSKREQE